MKFILIALCLLLAGSEAAQRRRYRNSRLMEQPNTFQNFRPITRGPANEIGFNRNLPAKAKFQQYFLGIPVYGANVVAPAHGVFNDSVIYGYLVDGIREDVPNVHPTIHPQDTIDHVMKRYAGVEGLSYTDHSAELMIYVCSQSIAHLVYRTSTLIWNTASHTPERNIMFMDAHDGSIVYHQYNGLTDAEAYGPGGNEKTGKYEYGTDYGALDVATSGNTCSMENADVLTCDLGHKYSSRCSGAYDFTCDTNDGPSINGAFCPINDAHYYGKVVFDMYSEWFDAAPLDFQLEMRVHYGDAYENAFWDGSAMTFGDGATMFYPLVSLDVVSHEVSHGFTEFNSGLEYVAESGGMNEAFSDMAGEAAKYYMKNTNDWLVGADIFKGNGALRYFKKPSDDGRSIDNADEYYNGLDVHYSSGVYNRAFYNVGTANGWDTKKAFEVFVRANQLYWQVDSTFEDGACGVLQASADLGYDNQAILDAFSIVKVDTSQCDTGKTISVSPRLGTYKATTTTFVQKI